MTIRLTLILVLLFSLQHSFAQTAFGYDMTLKVSNETLNGSWELKECKDLKFYGSKENFRVYDLKWKDLPAACFLKSTWQFNLDSTGLITTKGNDSCKTSQLFKFRYKLIESPGPTGPLYKMDITFDDGKVEHMVPFDYDGKKEIFIAYKKDYSGIDKNGYSWKEENVQVTFKFKKIK